MRRLVGCFLLICSAGFSTTRSEDLKVILEKTYLQSQCDPFLNMLAMEAISESEKKIDSEELVGQFKQVFSEEKTLAKLSKPYETLFSDEEVHELRKIYENPVWQKTSREGASLFQSQMLTMKDTFKELAASYVGKADLADGSILQVTQENFNQITESKIPVIVDVNASWCGACKMLAPVMDEMNEKYSDQILFAKIDSDSQGELTEQYQVTSLPTLLFFKPGQKKPVMRHVGAMSKQDFEAKIAEFLKK